MPISTFYGLQTSLRGLLAQQRALDITGHNIANANTAGLLAPGGGARRLAGAPDPGRQRSQRQRRRSSAPASTSQTYRRVRDQFLDLQYRAQNMAWASSPRALERARPASRPRFAEPGDNGINAAAVEFWDAWGDVAERTRTTPRRRQALVEQAAQRSPTRSSDLDDAARRRSRSRRQRRVRRAHRAPERRRRAERRREIADAQHAIKDAVAGGDQPNDLLDRRDLLLDQLSELGQVSVTDLGNGSINVAFGDAADPLVDDTTVAGAASTSAATPHARSPAASSARCSTSRQDRRHDRPLRSGLDAIANDLADQGQRDLQRRAARADFFSTARAPRPTLAVAVTDPRRSRRHAAAPRAPTTSRRRSPSLRGGATDRLYRAFVARIGADVQRRASASRPTRRRSSTRVEDRRQSVSGVSLDEEMTNMVRFQRAYQASARAMSTMDEMLDDADQPHRKGRALDDHAHHHRDGAAQRRWPTSTRAERRLAKTQEQVVLGQGDHAPVRRPVRHAPRAGPARARSSGTQQYQRNVDDAQRLAGRPPSSALEQITDVAPARPRAARPGRQRHDSTDLARRDRRRDRPAHRRRQAGGQRQLRRHATSSRAPRPTPPPYAPGGRRHLQRRRAARSSPRRSGPGVSLPINTLGVERPRRRQRRRRQAARRAARHLRPPARRHGRRRGALRTSDLSALDANLDNALQARARDGARTNRLDAAASSRLSDIEESTDQAALRHRGRRHGEDDDRLLHRSRPPTRPRCSAGANIVQASLLDFLSLATAALLPRRFQCHLTIEATRFGRSRSRRRRHRVPDGLIGLGGSPLRAARARRRRTPSCGCTRSTIPTSRCRSPTRGASSPTTRSSCPTTEAARIGIADADDADGLRDRARRPRCSRTSARTCARRSSSRGAAATR